MNSAKRFMALLENKRATQAWREMTSILTESHQYFQNIPASERALVPKILFNEETGILTFLNSAIRNLNMSKHLEAAIIQMFKLLDFVINEFSDIYFPYITATQTVCTLALTISASYYLKSAAAETFLTLVKTFASCALDFNETVNDWVKKFKYFKPTERRLILEVIAAISRYFPQTAAFERHAKSVRYQLMADLALACNWTKPLSVSGLVSYVEAINNILYNFPPSTEDKDKFYERLKALCTSEYCAMRNVRPYLTSHKVHNELTLALLNLISEHFLLFDEFVYEDYEFWQLSLKSVVASNKYGDSSAKALRTYYRTMGKVLEKKNSDTDKEIFLKLRNAFQDQLSDPELSSTDLRLAVYGFSQIIEPCKNYFAEVEVGEMFRLIAHRTIPRYAREDEDAAHLDEIADYQEALSGIICHMSNVTIDQVQSLMTLCSLLIKRFPQLSSTDQEYASSSLNRTIVNVSYAKESIYKYFISHIIHDGVVWTCSHRLLIDAELEKDVEKPSTSPIITYKDYLPLWQGLLNPANYSSTQNSEARAAALQTVFDEIIATCITLLNTLVLDVKSNENTIFPDFEISQTAENESDFRIFLNLVDLCVEVLANVEHFLWKNTLHTFLYEIIKNAYKNPLISGFYKLVNVVLGYSGAFESYQDSDEESFNLTLKFLWATLDSITQYSQELQISCLRLILNVPDVFVKRLVEGAVPAFKIAFTIGLTNYEVAADALAALDRWRNSLGQECPKDFIPRVVPFLERFLQSEETSLELLHDIEEAKERRRVKRVTLLDDELSVESFQKKILLFFGSLESDVMLGFIHDKSLKTGASWSKKDLLKYSLPFPDLNLEIKLDLVLPRIIQLARNSGDRRTRLPACEVLHTLVALMLGKTVTFIASDPDRFAPLYELLCPALLRLGCDSDTVIVQLFHPLVLQLTHWLSSRLVINSKATVHLVDSLFDALCDESDSALREVSGIYLAEFVFWSVKQSTDREIATGPTNIDLIVRRIIDFGLDPSPNKRVAAAIAFNNLYKILRENEQVVRLYWLSILHCFVKSLEGCHDARIHRALSHVERVLVERSELFEPEGFGGILPAGMSGVGSKDVAVWIFEQCGSLDRDCRKTCFKFFESVSRSCEDAGDPGAIVNVYLKKKGVEGLNKIVLGDLDEKFRAFSAEGLELFLKTVDLYVWWLREGLVEDEILFSEVNPQRDVVFNAINNFVCSLSITDSHVENTVSFRSRELAQLKTLRCEIVLALFDLLPLLLDVSLANPNFVPVFLFNEALFNLVATCLTNPRKVGFDSSNLQLSEELPVKLETLLKKAMIDLPEPRTNAMKSVLALNIKEFSQKLFQFDEITSCEISISERKMRGLQLLHECGLLRTCPDCHEIVAHAGVKITRIFGCLSVEELGRSVCVDLTLEVKTYFHRLLELLLVEYEPETMNTVVQLLTNDAKLYRSDLGTSISHGEYFLNVFKDVVMQGLLRDVGKTVKLLETFVHKNRDNVLRVLEELVLYLKRHRSKYQSILEEAAKTIIEKFASFERAVNDLEHRRNVLLNIYAVVVRLKKNPLDVSSQRGDLYRWILKELLEFKELTHKTRLLRNFLICLTNETSDNNPELQAILNNLRNERAIARPEGAIEGTVATPQTLDCYQTLLKLLPITKSLIVYDAVANFAQGAAKLLCEDNLEEYTKLYFNVIPRENASKSLELMYNRFSNAVTASDRFDVLNYFLLPSFNYCDSETTRTFFESHITSILSTLTPTPTEVLRDRQWLFVSQIGAYNLAEIMFAKIAKESIERLRTSEEPNSETPFRTIFRSTLSVRQLRAAEGEDRELFRRLQCAAYNCAVAIVSTVKEEKFYSAVFGENRAKGQFIWKNILDTSRHYNLRQTSKELPKERKKLVNIRKTERDKNAPQHLSYVKSYDLASSTLTENIGAYDLNAVNLIPSSSSVDKTAETMSLTLEVDDLNDHECMAPICGFLIHMFKNASSPPAPDQRATALPTWMAGFKSAMVSEHPNVRLFALKIVLNTQAVFRPYAEFLFGPILYTIRLCLQDQALNYVITDALVMLVDWSNVVVPKTEDDRNLANAVFSLLVEKATAAPTKYIVKYNLSIAEMVVNAWHEFLEVPEGLTKEMEEMNHQAVTLILIFLTNGMTEKLVDREDVWQYLRKCLAEWKIEEATLLRHFQAVGLLLDARSSSTGDFEESRNEIADTARNSFRNMQSDNPGRLVKCVHALCKACPDLTEEFFQFVSSSQLKVEHSNLAKCLEVFSLMIPKLSPENVVKELQYMQFGGLLENRVLACERVCLEIVAQLVEILEPVHLLPLVELLSTYSDHENPTYRQISYETAIKLHNRYSKTESPDSRVGQLIDIAKRILLNGLLDPADNMQTLASEFWSETIQLRNNCHERLIDVLDTFSSGLEKNFLQMMTLVLLQLTKKSVNYESKMFEPLHMSTYREYDVTLSSNRNFHSRIPLFAPSLAGQRLTQYSYAIGSSSYAQESRGDLMLRATNTPHFEATFLAAPSLASGAPLEQGTFAVPKVPDIPKNKVSRRFLSDWSETSSGLKKRQSARRLTEDTNRREHLARTRSNVRLYRKYRIGDFPDVEISHAMILAPLQQLVKRDSTICRNLTVCLIRSLIDRLNLPTAEKDSYCRELSEKLVGVLRKRRKNGPIVSAIFEVLFNVKELEYPWEVVAEVAKVDGLFAQGALLTECSLMREKEEPEPPAKRSRVDEQLGQSESVRKWSELAGLYESMGEVDVVLGIFRGEKFGEELRAASVARAAAEWEKAESHYRNALDSGTASQAERHCLEGMFDCMSRLSKWKNLENEIESRVKPDWAGLLGPHGSEADRWIEPWIFRTQTHRTLAHKANDAFLNALKSYLQNETKCQVLKELYGEEVAVILVKDRPDAARDFLNSSCDSVREKWIELNPLAASLVSNTLAKLQAIHDVGCYLSTVENPDITEASSKLLKLWQNSRPNLSDDLLSWDKRLSYRCHFTACLTERLRRVAESQEDLDLIQSFKSFTVGNMLKLVKCALSQRNCNVAKKYLRTVEPEIDECGDLLDEFVLNFIECNFLSAQTSNDPDKSLRYYTASWQKAHEFIRSEGLSENSRVAVGHIISTMASKFMEIATERPEFFANLIQRSGLVNDISTERIDFDSVAESLDCYSFSHLKKCFQVASQTADCHSRLSKYCYEKISTGGGDPQISREFVRSTLKAMSCGSEEASHYFPSLLKEDLLRDVETQEIFLTESSYVETWRFLTWQTQLLSHLGTPMGKLVMPIVKKIVETYPNALIYSLRLILDTNPELRSDPHIASLSSLLETTKDFSRFLEAIQYVVQPELYLNHHLKELQKNLCQGNKDLVDALVKKIYSAVAPDQSCSMVGPIHPQALRRYKPDIQRIIDMPLEDVKNHVDDLLQKLKQSLERRSVKTALRDYSPWLDEYVGRDIEVPGQYTGDRRPLPRYHARIIKLDSRVQVMQSLSRPIRITILANNARSYRFLVKFGEDLRLDQRIQQVFNLMNKTLKADVACSQRRLSVDTYQVFPLSSCLGFIQWVDGTKTLNDCVYFSLDESKRDQLRQVHFEYEDWIAQAAPGKGIALRYKEMLLNYSSAEVTSKMSHLSDKVGWDLLKNTFVLLSTSMDGFVALRRNFTTNYATMCIAQWILGIGDRHLGNTLISVESGRSLGIDFGLAFGGTINQAVPELVPFRLTAQIRGLLKPFSEKDLMGSTMIHVLRALRNGKGPLLACLDVVAHEDLNWEEHANKLSRKMQSEALDIKWLTRNKVSIVTKKLNGGKPSTITLKQLEENHLDDKYYNRYRDVVNGTDSGGESKRSLMRDDNLSPDEQVECLIEQATDLNVLGRMYAGWTPWL